MKPAYPISALSAKRLGLYLVTKFKGAHTSLKAYTDFYAYDQMRTRFNIDNEFMIDNTGISEMASRVKSTCYNSGGFYEKAWDKFEHRARVKKAKPIKDI